MDGILSRHPQLQTPSNTIRGLDRLDAENITMLLTEFPPLVTSLKSHFCIGSNTSSDGEVGSEKHSADGQYER